MSKPHHTLTFVLAALLASETTAQSTAPLPASSIKKDDVVQLETYVQTGSRFNDRTVTDSSVPIDVLSRADIQQNGYTEVAQTLSVLVPSITFPRPANTDGTDSIRPASLRGLGPDQTLVLLNGKRYHTSALVNLNGSVGRGSAAVDLNSIPSFALSGAEVLRDGAAAQYGSDAIAGVINLTLRRDRGTSFTATAGTTYAGDGQTFESSGNYGAALGREGGYISVTGFVRNRAKTNRSGLDYRQQYFGTNATTGALVAPGSVAFAVNGTPDSRETTFKRRDSVFGDPESHERGVSYNVSFPTARGIELYSFALLSDKTATSFATWRRPADNTDVRAIYPDGFQPQINPRVEDLSFTGGARGKVSDWTWDLSETWGENTVDYFTRHSLNVTYGTASPTDFYAGQLAFTQSTTNLDLTRSFAIGLPAPLKTAVGAEFRWENYQIKRGDTPSWDNGGVLILDGPSKGTVPSFGAQGFPGYRPTDETDSSRHNVAGYVDLETDLTSKWRASLAGRAERYNDAGSTVTGKFATRYAATSWLAFRGSASNGFRAPALQQDKFTTTSAVILAVNGVNTPVEVKTFQVSSPAAVALGATPLKPEKSTNLSGGITLEPFTNFSTSIDYYNIFISDRIVLSSNFSNASVSSYLASLGYPGLGGGRYFTNAVDSRTEGVDVTSRYTWKLLQRDTLTLTAGYNHNATRVTHVKATPDTVLALTGGTPIFDRQNLLRFERGTPRDKYTFSATYDWNRRLTALVREVRYGEVLSAGTTSATDQTLGAKWVTDLEVAYHFNRHLTLAVGANNAFDVYPDKLNAANNTSGLNLYSSFSPFGFNGGFYYTRLDLSF